MSERPHCARCARTVRWPNGRWRWNYKSECWTVFCERCRKALGMER